MYFTICRAIEKYGICAKTRVVAALLDVLEHICNAVECHDRVVKTVY